MTLTSNIQLQSVGLSRLDPFAAAGTTRVVDEDVDPIERLEVRGKRGDIIGIGQIGHEDVGAGRARQGLEAVRAARDARHIPAVAAEELRRRPSDSRTGTCDHRALRRSHAGDAIEVVRPRTNRAARPGDMPRASLPRYAVCPRPLPAVEVLPRLPSMTNSQWRFETQQIHAGASPDPVTNARATPIYKTTSYVFNSAQHAKNLFALAEFGNIYNRIQNPTQAVVEERVANLEGGTAALLLASGQAAETYAVLNIAQAGDHIVSSASIYGGTYNLFKYTLAKLGIETTFVENQDDADEWRRAVRPNTKLFFAETIGNPQINILDIELVVGCGPRERRAADRRQHDRDAVPDPSRSSTAPTSWCTPPPSSSAATAWSSAA